jgi:hypothetical protein
VVVGQAVPTHEEPIAVGLFRTVLVRDAFLALEVPWVAVGPRRAVIVAQAASADEDAPIAVDRAPGVCPLAVGVLEALDAEPRGTTLAIAEGAIGTRTVRVRVARRLALSEEGVTHQARKTIVAVGTVAAYRTRRQRPVRATRPPGRLGHAPNTGQGVGASRSTGSTRGMHG